MAEAKVPRTAAPAQFSRKCGAREEEEQAPTLQAKAAGSAEASVGAAPPIVYEAMGGPGTTLDGPTRALFEPRFRWAGPVPAVSN